VQPEGPAAKSISRGLPGNHLFPIDELLRFVGTTTQIPPVMFLRHSRPRVGKFVEMLFGSYYFAITLLNCRNKLLVYSLTPNMLQGETVLVDSDLRSNILRCARSLQPFCVVRTDRPNPVAATCATLGIDPANDLTVFLIINTLILFLAHRNGRPVVVHLATFPNAQKVIDLHRRGLEVAGCDKLPQSVRGLVPELIAFSERDGYSILTQTRLPGEPLILCASDVDFYAMMDRALQPLLEFRATATHYVEGADAELLFKQFPLLPERWPEFSNILIPLISRLQTWQKERDMVPILTHGDYWIRNILFDRVSRQVTGIVDWERARLNGIPGFDALHLLMTSLTEPNSDICDYLEQTWTGNWESEPAAEYVQRVQDAYGLTPEDIAHLGVFLYLDEFYKQKIKGVPFSPLRLEKLRKLIPSLECWYSTTASISNPHAHP
jgi:hypothetical protein